MNSLSAVYTFTNQALMEAENLSEIDIIENRIQNQVITIDPAGAKDLDDGIFVSMHTGCIVLDIAITDVSSFITPGSTLDQIAIARKHSIYDDFMPAPMLPPILSENKFSLLQNTERPTITLRSFFDFNFNLRDYEILQTATSVLANFSYEDIDNLLGDKTKANSFNLSLASKLALNLKAARKQKAVVSDFCCSHTMVEEFMIHANNTISQIARSENLAFIFRNFDEKIDTRAFYDARSFGHSQLLVKDYGHFTSPIRRAPDLISHRAINACLLSLPQEYNQNDLDGLCKHFNQRFEEIQQRQEEHIDSSYNPFHINNLVEHPELIEHAEPEMLEILYREIYMDQLALRSVCKLAFYESYSAFEFINNIRNLILAKAQESSKLAQNLLLEAVNQHYNGIQDLHFLITSNHSDQFMIKIAFEKEGKYWCAEQTAIGPNMTDTKRQACLIALQAYFTKTLREHPPYML